MRISNVKQAPESGGRKTKRDLVDTECYPLEGIDNVRGLGAPTTNYGFLTLDVMESVSVTMLQEVSKATDPIAASLDIEAQSGR